MLDTIDFNSASRLASILKECAIRAFGTGAFARRSGGPDMFQILGADALHTYGIHSGSCVCHDLSLTFLEFFFFGGALSRQLVQSLDVLGEG